MWKYLITRGGLEYRLQFNWWDSNEKNWTKSYKLQGQYEVPVHSINLREYIYPEMKHDNSIRKWIKQINSWESSLINKIRTCAICTENNLQQAIQRNKRYTRFIWISVDQNIFKYYSEVWNLSEANKKKILLNSQCQKSTIFQFVALIISIKSIINM